MPVLEIQYSSVEPLLTVFGVAESESLRKIKREVIQERSRRAQVQDKMADLEETVDKLKTENRMLKAKLEEHGEIVKRFERLLELLEEEELLHGKFSPTLSGTRYSKIKH